MFKKLLIFTILLFNISFASQNSVVKNFQKFISKYGTMEGKFVYKMYTKGFDKPDIYNGYLIMTKDGRVYVKYTEPEEMIIFLKGNRVISYSKEDNQAMIKRISDEFFYLKLFRMIIKNEDIKTLFKQIKEYTIGKSLDYELVMIPKNKEIKKVIVRLSKDYKIKRLTIITEDAKVIYDFSKIKYLKGIKKVNFKLPKGVEIIK